MKNFVFTADGQRQNQENARHDSRLAQPAAAHSEATSWRTQLLDQRHMQAVGAPPPAGKLGLHPHSASHDWLVPQVPGQFQVVPEATGVCVQQVPVQNAQTSAPRAACTSKVKISALATKSEQLAHRRAIDDAWRTMIMDEIPFEIVVPTMVPAVRGQRKNVKASILLGHGSPKGCQ